MSVQTPISSVTTLDPSKAGESHLGNSIQEKTTDTLPVVIVGNGPIGMRAVSEILSRNKSVPIVIFGEETHLPYDRVKLSSWLIGDVVWRDLESKYRRPFGSSLDERYGHKIVSIDREKKLVIEADGTQTRYEKLILATGSHAHVPDIEGIHINGVFTLRSVEDATKLFARRNRSRHTVVIGGGLLGLESARGMQKQNTRVTIVEHSDRLMANQLDLTAAGLLASEVESMGFHLRIGDGAAKIVGSEAVIGLQLRSGEFLECDTILIATGIRPNIELAKQTGLAFNRGIKVDNYLLTSDPDIYAIGECAEHKGEVYGLVAPGFEHASTAANHITGSPGEYHGSLAATRLKVVGTNVFSVGSVGHTAHPLATKSLVYRDKENQNYRKLLIQRHKLVGAVALGQWDQSLRVQSAINTKQWLSPWRKFLFLKTGNIWPDDNGRGVTAWPDDAVVCQCNRVTKGTITHALNSGCTTVEQIGRNCGAGMVCGSCKPQLNNFLDGKETSGLPYAPYLVGLALAALVVVLGIALLPPIEYASSVQNTELLGRTISWHWDSLWRNSLFKQISGFIILGAVSLALLVSVRKRTKQLKSFGRFDSWRLAHLAFSCIALASLLAHTGLRMGHGLNFALMALFVSLITLGVLSTFAMITGSNGSSQRATTIKQLSLRLHIYLFWPIPLLLGWHIFKGYWY